MSDKPKLRPMVLPEQKIALLTNGKCGGTSLNHWFFLLATPPLPRRNFYDLARNFTLRFAVEVFFAKNIKNRPLRYDTDLELRRSVEIYRRSVGLKWAPRISADDFTKIFVVRDPVDRCLSGFLDKFVGGDCGKQFVREVIEYFPGQEGISFSQFIEYLEVVGVNNCNGHWRRQTYVADKVRGYLHVVRLEYFNKDVQNIHSLKYKPKLPQRNVSRPRNSRPTLEMPAYNVKSDELRRIKEKYGALPPKTYFLDSGLVRRIKRVYKSDYERLPYI